MNDASFMCRHCPQTHSATVLDCFLRVLVRKIFKTGNSVVVSLPKDAVEYLRMEEGSEVNVELNREKNQIEITPVQSSPAIAGIDPEFAHQVSEFIEQYHTALDELAK
jgi:putative addiction module antidote